MKGGVLIVQSGGPTAVSNTILAAAVAEGRVRKAANILGARHGMLGLVNQDFIDLRPVSEWEKIAASPGAALGSSRYRATREEIERIPAALAKRGIQAVLFVGGNGTMQAATEVAVSAGGGLSVAALPDTVDNDVIGTDFCPGFASCARFSAQFCIDVATDVRSLPTPVSITELMGRNTGWIAASTSLARRDPDDAPHRIYVPEIPVDSSRVLQDIQEIYDRLGWVSVVVAEGVKDENGASLASPVSPSDVSRFGGAMVGDVGPVLARLVTSRLGLRARCEKPGLAARSAFDRRAAPDVECAAIGARFAINELLDGTRGFMAAFRRESSSPLKIGCQAVPFDEVEPGERTIPPEWLFEPHCRPNEGFIEYAAPLVGGFHHHRTLMEE